jgi:hypothetical protein
MRTFWRWTPPPVSPLGTSPSAIQKRANPAPSRRLFLHFTAQPSMHFGTLPLDPTPNRGMVDRQAPLGHESLWLGDTRSGAATLDSVSSAGFRSIHLRGRPDVYARQPVRRCARNRRSNWDFHRSAGISLWDSNENAEAYQKDTYPEVQKHLSKVIDGTPKVQTYEVSSSTFHKVAAGKGTV